MQPVERLLKWAANALFLVAAALVAAMMVHIVADVVFKYLLNYPISMTTEMVAHYYMVAVVFLPLPLVEFRNSSVSVDLFYRLFSAPVRRMVLLLAYVGQVFFFGILAYQSWFDALGALQARKFVYVDTRMEIWLGTFFLPLGFFLAALVCVLRIQQILTRSDWEHLSAVQSFDEPTLESK